MSNPTDDAAAAATKRADAIAAERGALKPANAIVPIIGQSAGSTGEKWKPSLKMVR